MRKILLIATVLVLPMNAMAQTAQTAAEKAAQAAQTAAETAAQAAETAAQAAERAAQTAQSLAEDVPTPTVDDSYRVAAIVAGAVVGAMVASVLTGGTATPVLLTGAGEAELATWLAEGAGILIGAYIGKRASSN